LESFSESGMLGLAANRQKMFEQIEALQQFKKMQVSNDSFFSYVFLADKRQEYCFEYVSTNLAAFIGTFMLTGFLLLIALLAFVLEEAI